MKQISEKDYKTIMECLMDYIRTPSSNLREFNRRRKAKLVLRKYVNRLDKNTSKDT